ncbi:hypothetical protein FB548_3515 [Pseudoxanthomonas sp. 3HH-4]|uniref:hypothetical protein n=1 Tax=Pseudoxanthomonas sp. 3HH-4 TaxID=1690214 RepID=UPI0011512559|nr:hypothetical protein [Pseudoxanthomonas sp. 3HH-4]TQM05772.1 hypothetical protein FB548_3515 [Pseudoxanthomonas sp. 3HH-4]
MNQNAIGGTRAAGLAAHAAAIQALAQSGADDLQATLRDLRTVLLSADPRALRRSVGFWGRLIGRDIRLAAEARSLRERSGILLRQAGFEASRLRNQHAMLATHARQLREACAQLQQEIDGLARQQAMAEGDTPAGSLRLAHLITLRSAYEITASQLDLVAANALAIAERHAQQLPRLTVLLDQQLGVAAGADHGMQLSSAMRTIEALEAHIEHLPAPSVVSATPARATPAQEAP